MSLLTHFVISLLPVQKTKDLGSVDKSGNVRILSEFFAGQGKFLPMYFCTSKKSNTEWWESRQNMSVEHSCPHHPVCENKTDKLKLLISLLTL